MPVNSFDEAQRLGMTVMLGLWVQHERHGFDYDNESKVKAQLDYFTEVVKTYKGPPRPPAVGCW